MAGKLTAEEIAQIHSAPYAEKNADLARKFKISRQYVGQIRKGHVAPLATLVSVEDTNARLESIRGVSTMIQKRAQAADDLMDCVLLELDDLKRTADPIRRGKRISVLARSLRDIADATTVLKGVGPLAEMTNEELRDALLKLADEPEPKDMTQ